MRKILKLKIPKNTFFLNSIGTRKNLDKNDDSPIVRLLINQKHNCACLFLPASLTPSFVLYIYGLYLSVNMMTMKKKRRTKLMKIEIRKIYFAVCSCLGKSQFDFALDFSSIRLGKKEKIFSLEMRNVD